MKLNFVNLKCLAVLAVLAGCATESDVVRSSVNCADQKATATAPETFADAYKRHLAAVRKWGAHTPIEEVALGVPAALQFVATHANESEHAAEIAELRYRIVETLARGRDYETGVPVARAVYADAKADAARRSAAAEYLAMNLVETKKDYAGADAVYVGLLDPERANGNKWTIARLIGQRAGLCILRDDKEGALKYIASERSHLAGKPDRVRELNALLDEECGKVYAAFYDYRGQVDYYLSIGRKDLAFGVLERGLLSDIPLAERLAHEIILDDSSYVGLRATAWCWLYGRDEAFCRANVGRCVDRSAVSTNRFVSAVTTRIVNGNVRDAYGPPSPAYWRNPEMTASLWEIVASFVKSARIDLDFRCAQYGAVAYAELGNRAKAVEAAETGLSYAKKLSPADVFELKLMIEVLRATGTADEITAKVKAAVASLDTGVDPKDLRNRIERVGGLALVTRDEALARGYANYYSATYRTTLEKKVYDVRFSDRTIECAADFARLAFTPVESDFDRVYGGKGLAFMTTDVATGDRGNAVKGGGKVRKYPTTLQAVADEWGVHFVYTFYDSRARQFESGELDGGSFESYIAAGENQPYICFLSYPKKDAGAYIVNMAYDQPGNRRVYATDTKSYRSETRFTDDKVSIYVAFSWDAYADHVPVNGGEWDFESIFWGPVQSAWNGTASIHGRSTWGKLRFTLDDAARVKILRAQLFKAVAAYRAEKQPKPVLRDSVQEGVFAFWSDDAIGDPAFYAKCLKPLMAELDPVAERVKVGMSDEEVKAIVETYLPRFRNLRNDVSALRTRYLEESLGN